VLSWIHGAIAHRTTAEVLKKPFKFPASRARRPRESALIDASCGTASVARSEPGGGSHAEHDQTGVVVSVTVTVTVALSSRPVAECWIV
jgi:hypothetical protein